MSHMYGVIAVTRKHVFPVKEEAQCSPDCKVHP